MSNSADKPRKRSDSVTPAVDESASESSAFDYAEEMKPLGPVNESFFYRYRAVLPNSLTMGNALSGIFAAYYAVQGKFSLCSFFVVLGFIFDAFDGPCARYLKCSGDFGMYMDSLADVTCFGAAPTLALLTYFQDNFPLAVCLAATHFTCTVCRLAKFMTEEGPAGLFRGMPCPFAGVFNVAVIAGEVPRNLIIVGSLIHSYYMIAFDTTYVKPFSVKSKLMLAFVWFLHILALCLVSTFTPLGNQLLSLIPIFYGSIPAIVRFYRWLFLHAKQPSQFDYVLTVGVYDLFHGGHLELFSHMAAMGRNLLVAVHDEKSVYQNKKIHTTDSLEKRMNNVRRMKKVKAVYPVYTADPSAVIQQMLDAVPKGKSVCYMRGDDWLEFPGKGVLTKNNVPIIYHHYTEGVSSSLLRLARKQHTI